MIFSEIRIGWPISLCSVFGYQKSTSELNNLCHIHKGQENRSKMDSFFSHIRSRSHPLEMIFEKELNFIYFKCVDLPLFDHVYLII